MAEPSSTTRRDQVIAALVAIIGALAVAALQFLLSRCDPAQQPPPPPPPSSSNLSPSPSPIQLTITSPANGGTVKAREDIRIRLSSTLPDGQEVWAVVDSQTDGRRYPQGVCQLLNKTEASCTGRFGKPSPESVGRTYIITAVIINSTDAPSLTSLKDGGYPTTDRAPAALLVQSPSITVKRI